MNEIEFDDLLYEVSEVGKELVLKAHKVNELYEKFT
jgi:hypothetical protein